MENFENLFEEYNIGFRNIGMNVPESATARVIPDQGNSVIYNAQERSPGIHR